MGSPQVGIDFAIEIGGTKIGGRRGGTLTLGTETEDVSNADNNSWQSTINTLRSWQVSSDGLWIVDTPVAGAGSSIEVEDDNDPAAFQDIEHAQSVDISFASEAIQISSFTTGRDPEHLYGIRSSDISLTGLYADPEGAPGVKRLLQAREAGENVKLRVSFAGSTVEGEYTMGDFSIESPYNEAAAVSVDLQSANEPTITEAGGLDNGIAALVAVFTAATPSALNVIMKVAGGSEYAGSAILSSFGVTVPHDGAIEVTDVTLDGSGPLTRTETT